MEKTDEWRGEIPVDGKPKPTFPQDIELEWWQFYAAAQAGLTRYVVSKERGHKDHHGFNGRGALIKDIAAAAAELAASIAIGEKWPFSVNTFHSIADVGDDWEVRCTTILNGGLVVRPGDNDKRRYILVIIQDPIHYRVVGFKWGYEAKNRKWLQPDNDRPAFYLIPQQDLDTW